MSLHSAHVRMYFAPATAGRMPSRAGDITSIITTTITTGTTRPGRSIVRS